MTFAVWEKGKTMADEYINKKDVVDLGVMMQTHLWTREQTYNAIFCLPTADVAPVRHGHWKVIDAEEPRRYGCSECKRLSWYMENYCPNCGSRMDGESDDE